MKKQSSFFQHFYFLGFGIMIIIISLAPINLIPNFYTTPDFLFCFVFSWSVRHHERSFIIDIVFLSILADFLFMKPPGLWSFLTLICIGVLRRRFLLRNELNIKNEIILFICGFTSMVVLANFMYFLTMIPIPDLRLLTTHWLLTLIVYPFFSIFFVVLHKIQQRRTAQ